MNCCTLCKREKDVDYWYGDVPAYDCIDESCPCHTTSPEKKIEDMDWEQLLPYEINGHDTTKYADLLKQAFTRTLDNQKKEVLAVLEGLRKSSQVYSEEVATHNMALDEAITKITNL